MFALPVLSGCAATPVLPDPGVVMDSRFDEWKDVPVLLHDPADVSIGEAIDLGAIQGAADGRHLYFTVQTRRRVNAQAMRGTLSVLLDTDNNPETGVTVDKMDGVDLVVELSRQGQVDAAGYGSGVGVLEVGPTGLLEVPSDGDRRDLLVAPTSSSDRFEIRLGRTRGGRKRAAELDGSKARVGFVFSSQGRVVDRTTFAALRLPPLEETPPPPWSEALDRRGDVRILVWNVASEGFRDRADRFARIMAAVNPDVLLLDEVYGSVTEVEIRAFLSTPEMAPRGPWEFVLGMSGGRQKTVVASRIGIRPEPSFQEIPYPEGSLASLGDRFPEGKPLFDLERERGLASVGAWIDVAGRPVLIVPIDLQSAGYEGSFQDELRILQARVLRDFVGQALVASGPGAAVVIGGDLNLVGSATPLDSLVRGLDGGSDLIAVDTYRLTDRSMATWRNDGAPFSPGRLDYVLISGSTLSAERGFAFHAGELSEGLRERLGVEAEDSDFTSDHLPLVVDLSVRR